MTSDNLSYPDLQFKLIILGDPYVGKTSILLRYCDGVF